jgi:uncharacterized membrane protein YczE
MRSRGRRGRAYAEPVHAPPVIRGGLAVRLAVLVLGLAWCSLGIVFLLESSLGLSPWDVLHQGIERHTPLSFGVANVVVAIVVVGIAALLGARIGFGTVANALLIGVLIDAYERVGAIRGLDGSSLGLRVALLALGIACFGIGSALYMGANLGAGPRDSLMLVISRRVVVRVGLARAALEVSVLVVGFVLGGTVGVGTVAFALLVGPAVEAAFFLLARSPLAIPGVAAPALRAARA